MSRRPTRAANAQKRAARDARKERAAERPASPTVVRTSDTARERVWTALLVGGAAVVFGLLGRELADAYADRGKPTLWQNDLTSALSAAAVLLVVGVFAYRRRRLQQRGERA